MRHFTFVLLLLVGCASSSDGGKDASVLDGSASSDGGADAVEAAACGPVLANPCNCQQPMPVCCALLTALPPSCQTQGGQPSCLPECNSPLGTCNGSGGALGDQRPVCTSAADCAAFPGLDSCCVVACQPNQLSACFSAAEATSRGLRCL